MEHSLKIRIFYTTKMSFKAAQLAEELEMVAFLMDKNGDVRPFNDHAFALGLAADLRRGNVSSAIADYWSWRMTDLEEASKFSPLEPVTSLLSKFFSKPAPQHDEAASDLFDAGRKIAAHCFFEHDFLPPGPTLDYVREVASMALRAPVVDHSSKALVSEIQSQFLPTLQLAARHSDGTAYRPLQAPQGMRPARASLGAQLPMMAQRSVTTTPRSSLGATVSPRCSAGVPPMLSLHSVSGLGNKSRAGAAVVSMAARLAAIYL
jgi:hypothetical protein